MPTEANTTAEDVERYVETDLDDPEIVAYIDDAEAEVLTYNDVDDFRDGELDRLVKFYTALLIEEVGSAGGETKTIKQGDRRVTLTTPGEDRSPIGWLRARIRANDPSGQLLRGRNNVRYVSFSGSGGDGDGGSGGE